MRTIEQRKGKAYNLYLTISKEGWLQKRDLEILLTVHRFRFVRFSDLLRMYFPGASGRQTAHRRLGKLYEYRLIDRIRQWVSADTTEYCYFLGDVGAYHLANYMKQNVDEIGWKSTDKNIRLSYMQHHLDAMKLYLQIRRLCVLTKFEPEVTLKGEGFNFRPDAFATLQKGKHEHRIFFEVDRGTEGESRILQKVKNYEIYRASKSKTYVMPWVVFATEKKVRLDKLKAWVDKHRRTDMYRFWTFGELEKGITYLGGMT